MCKPCKLTSSNPRSFVKFTNRDLFSSYFRGYRYSGGMRDIGTVIDFVAEAIWENVSIQNLLLKMISLPT